MTTPNKEERLTEALLTMSRETLELAYDSTQWREGLHFEQWAAKVRYRLCAIVARGLGIAT